MVTRKRMRDARVQIVQVVKLFEEECDSLIGGSEFSSE